MKRSCSTAALEDVIALMATLLHADPPAAALTESANAFGRNQTSVVLSGLVATIGIAGGAGHHFAVTSNKPFVVARVASYQFTPAFLLASISSTVLQFQNSRMS